VAILRDRELLASEVASQIKEHERYGGVVPEVASRNHLVHAPRLLERVLQATGISLDTVDAFAATAGPGLASSLMIGASISKGLALGQGKPYLAINHLEGHLLSPFLGPGSGTPATTRGLEPNVSLIVSGGHTLLVEVRGVNNYRVMGRTVDDAAGEAFDKVAKLLGLGYPGGPEIERRARAGDPTRFDLPRSMLDSRDHNFSFSGLKTAVRYLLPKLELTLPPTVIPSESEGPHELQGEIARSFADAQDDRVVADVCASFQAAVIHVLTQKTLGAAREAGAKVVTVSGGVSCNRALREQLRVACEEAGLKFLSAKPELCTDNAAMIAFVASLRLQAGFVSRVDQDIDPNLVLAGSG
jgi:N6-L-threonylcarbamoyladenine synthase